MKKAQRDVCYMIRYSRSTALKTSSFLLGELKIYKIRGKELFLNLNHCDFFFEHSRLFEQFHNRLDLIVSSGRVLVIL